MNDKISIIIPIYNAREYLKECIESVLFQSYDNWQLILIDDGSTDNSIQICNKYLFDSRIKLIRSNHLGLPGRVRNIGIKNAIGKYIFFMDSDDYIEKNTLELLYKFHTENKADLTVCNFKKIKNDKVEKRTDNVILNNWLLNKNDIISHAITTLDQQNKNMLFVLCWGKLYDTSIIKNNNILFNKELYTYEDIEFNFNYLKHVNRVYYTSDVLYNYRIHNSATFTIDFKRFFNNVDSLKSIRTFFVDYLDKKTLSKKIGNSIISTTIIQLIRAGVNNKKEIIKFYDNVVNNLDIRKNLKYYRPKRNESFLIPLLIFFKLKKLLYFIVSFKSRKRYKA